MSNQLGTFYKCREVSQHRTDSSPCLSLLFLTVHVSQQQQHASLRSCCAKKNTNKVGWGGGLWIKEITSLKPVQCRASWTLPEDKIKGQFREKSLKWILQIWRQHIFTENEILVKTFLNHVLSVPYKPKWFCLIYSVQFLSISPSVLMANNQSPDM